MNMKKKVFRSFYQVKVKFWTSLDSTLPLQRVQVPSLVRELRSHLLHSSGKTRGKKKRKKNPCFSQCSEEEKKIRGNEAKSVDIHE